MTQRQPQIVAVSHDKLHDTANELYFFQKEVIASKGCMTHSKQCATIKRIVEMFEDLRADMKVLPAAFLGVFLCLSLVGCSSLRYTDLDGRKLSYDRFLMEQKISGLEITTPAGEKVALKSSEIKDSEVLKTAVQAATQGVML